MMALKGSKQFFFCKKRTKKTFAPIDRAGETTCGPN
jgi:hypothetical protein